MLRDRVDCLNAGLVAPDGSTARAVAVCPARSCAPPCCAQDCLFLQVNTISDLASWATRSAQQGVDPSGGHSQMTRRAEQLGPQITFAGNSAGEPSPLSKPAGPSRLPPVPLLPAALVRRENGRRQGAGARLRWRNGRQVFPDTPHTRAVTAMAKVDGFMVSGNRLRQVRRYREGNRSAT
jgi:hypothetical protein